MPLVRNVVKDFRVEEAKSERKCHANSSHRIQAGEKHFAYDEAIKGRQNICVSCSREILVVASDHIEKIKKELLI
ncbi:hypothetical protein ACWOVX_004426 [Vibrio vulnificus]|nr:hypothetical protein [Vibrio vulnificus]EHH1191766.1 hypothetical protein [Vibrio vulnificus]EHU4850359.1 hypothetical protein [Vibrio vulnificus]EIA1304940.1 hypothetical protein [Vibrio vulnificus]EJE8536225.1 hypothetical protein [Vibrio vulnificus]